MLINFERTTITQTTYLYQYRSHLDIVLTNGSNAKASHLKDTLWYIDNGDLLACDPSKAE